MTIPEKMDKFTTLYYINLNYRTDRRAQFENWIQESNFPLEKVERIEAVGIPGRPHIGCGLSHIKALETFIASGQSYGFIFEDDYEPLDSGTFWKSIEQIFTSGLEFDVVLCSYNQLQSIDTDIPYIKQVFSSMTASGYIVTRDYAPRLRDCLLEAHQLALEEEARTHRKTDQYMNDVYWMKLMHVDRWYCYYPRLGKQRAGYSDLQGHFTDYNA